MLPFILGLVQRLALWFLAILLLGGEYLDWFGRLEVLETRHPRVHRFVESRSLRLVLLLLVFAMLATDLQTNLKELNSEPLIVKVSVPSPDPGAKNAEVEQLKAEIAALKAQIPHEGSLKIRTVRMADDLDQFFRQRAKHAPTCNQTSTMTPDEQRAVIAPCSKYYFEGQSQYQGRFAPEVMAMVQEFKAKGVDVRNIENCASESICGIAISVQLRAFAALLDANDGVKR